MSIKTKYFTTALKRAESQDYRHFRNRTFRNGFGSRTTGLQTYFTVTVHKGAARGGAEGAQAPPLAIRILMFIS